MLETLTQKEGERETYIHVIDVLGMSNTNQKPRNRNLQLKCSTFTDNQPYIHMSTCSIRKLMRMRKGYGIKQQTAIHGIIQS